MANRSLTSTASLQWRTEKGHVLHGLPDAFSCYMVVATRLTERLAAAPRSTVSANRHSAVSAFGHSTVIARRTYVAVAIHMDDLAVLAHAAFLSLSNSVNNSRTR